MEQKRREEQLPQQQTQMKQKRQGEQLPRQQTQMEQRRQEDWQVPPDLLRAAE